MTGRKLKSGKSRRAGNRAWSSAGKRQPFKSKRRTAAVRQGNANPWPHRAYQAGWRAGSAVKGAAVHPESHFHESGLQSSFAEWISASMDARPEFPLLKKISTAYVQGYNKGANAAEKGMPLPLQGNAAAVVCASSEEDSLDGMLNELERLPLKDIILVLNGSRDNSYAISRKHPLVTAVYFPELLGHDVGRSVGARLTDADIVLFCDGDMVVPAEELAPFIYAVDGGCDAALNDLSGFLPPFVHQDEVTHCKSFVNRALGRGDLGACSLTAVPHALSSRLIREIDAKHLSVPPKAQALAIAKGYRVQAVHAVDVVKGNRRREGNTGKGNGVAGLIIGDHAEAMEEWFRLQGMSASSARITRKDVALKRNAI